MSRERERRLGCNKGRYIHPLLLLSPTPTGCPTKNQDLFKLFNSQSKILSLRILQKRIFWDISLFSGHPEQEPILIIFPSEFHSSLIHLTHISGGKKSWTNLKNTQTISQPRFHCYYLINLVTCQMSLYVARGLIADKQLFIRLLSQGSIPKLYLSFKYI